MTEYTFERGPFLVAAVLCERVLAEQDGVASIIRIVDRVTRTATGPNPPSSLEPFEYTLWAYISFKSGSARGMKDLTIRVQKPSGESPPEQTIPVHFEGEDDRGVTTVIQLQLMVDVIGVWWFDIALDGVRVTRMPLRVIYMRQPMSMPPGPEGRPG